MFILYLQKNDVKTAISKFDQFDFLIDIIRAKENVEIKPIQYTDEPATFYLTYAPFPTYHL